MRYTVAAGALLIIAAAVCFLILARFFQQPPQDYGDSPPHTAVGCGTWRWPVKTLTDPAAGQVNFTPVPSTVEALAARTRPEKQPVDRLAPDEEQSYTVQARLVAAVVEDDSDIHLILADPETGQTMIAKFPAAACIGGASVSATRAMDDARASFVARFGIPKKSSQGPTPLTGTAMVTGVFFFDAPHGQSGVAPNAAELHPVLNFVPS
jgi:hypothetical protein